MDEEQRLIYAEALKRRIGDLHFLNYGMAIMAVCEAPTVDAIPVVHAEWIDGCAIHNGKEVYQSIDCSECEEAFKIESHDRAYWKKRFKVCPFCGAVMDGGNEGMRMAKKCGDCLYFGFCKKYIDPEETFPEIEGGCNVFERKADYVKVVRCKDCKWFGRDMGYDKHDCKKYEMPYCLENDFCSYGERREGE